MADEYRMFILGEWTGSEDGATFEATSPLTGEVIGTPFGGRAGSESGVGRVGGHSSIDRLTEPKTIVVHLG
jgi:acyl-CoA reductase-like NAD-dependent aldehyde dehydrogenase